MQSTCDYPAEGGHSGPPLGRSAGTLHELHSKGRLTTKGDKLEVGGVCSRLIVRCGVYEACPWSEYLEYISKYSKMSCQGFAEPPCWIGYLAELGARRPSPSWCCPGCRPGSGTWLSLAAGRGWPAGSRTAARPGGTPAQRSTAGPPGSSASGWRASGPRRPRSAAGPYRRGMRKRTRWARPPWADLGRVRGKWTIERIRNSPME